jgi:hypothetical protein
LRRHRKLLHAKTAKLINERPTFWEALCGRLFPAEGAGTGTGTSSRAVTPTLNRIVYPIEDLVTAIGAAEFMRDGQKKKMLVKNTTTDMSDATIGLLTAVAKVVVPDLPPPKQIHYKVNPVSERRDRLNRFAGCTEGVLGVVGMITQGTDIPSMNAVFDCDAPIGKPTRDIEKYVYSKGHTQLVGRPTRKDSKNPDKTCWYHCLPGVELETEEITSKEQLIELLKTMAGQDFGVYSTYSVFHQEHSNDGGVTFLVPAKRGLGGVAGGGGDKQLQWGQVINQASTIELDAGDIEGIRACIEARERPDESFEGLVVDVGTWRDGVVDDARQAFVAGGGDPAKFKPPEPRRPRQRGNEGGVAKRVYKETMRQRGTIKNRGKVAPKRSAYDLKRLAQAMGFPSETEWLR